MSKVLILAGSYNEAEWIARENELGRNDWRWLDRAHRRLDGTRRAPVWACPCWSSRGVYSASEVDEIRYGLRVTEADVTEVPCWGRVEDRSLAPIERDTYDRGLHRGNDAPPTDQAKRDILDVVDDAVESRCACGCGKKLDPSGDSVWFAGPACQTRFHARNATNPQEVWNSDDAAPSYRNGWDHLQIPLNEGDLRRAYLDAPPSAHAPRRGSAFRDAFGQPGDRIRYQHLTPDEREALHAWVELHDVDHTRVPIDARFELDETANEWLIPVYALRDGHSYLDDNGEVATEVLRRPNRAELPWPRVQPEPEGRVPSAQSPVFEFTGDARLRINSEEITDYVRSIDLNPMIDDTSYGDTTWREMLSGLRTGSLTIGGNWDWMANETVTVPPEQVERGVIADVEQTHWLTERLRRPDGTLRRLSAGPFRSLLADGRRPEDYWSYEPSTVQDWIAANPTVGERVEPGAVADFAESLGLELEPWQRQMLDAVYTEPQPRLFGGRGVLTSETLNAAEDRVRQSYGGAVGNILGVPIISSPFVPEGEMYLVNQQPPRFRFEPEPMRWDSNMMRWRMYAHMMPPPQCGDMLLFGNHYHISYCREHMPNRRERRRGAGYTPPRNNPRLKALHVHYRQRVLARRRRRRNR